MTNEGPRFCHNCGNPVTLPGAQFCTVCGKELLREASLPPPTSEPSEPIPESSRGTKRQDKARPRREPKPQQPRRLGILRVNTIFGLFDIVGLVALVVGLAIWWLWPDGTATCDPLQPPSGHTVAGDRDPLQGEVQGFTVLEAGRDYVVAAGKSLVVPDGATLLIEPGAQLAFEQGAALDVYGRLHACGTNKQPIIFSSSVDLDQAITGRPKAGDWIGIRFHQGSDSRSVIGQARIRYAGHNNHGAIHLEGSAPRITGVKITDCAWFPISMDADSDPALGGQIEMESVPYRGVEVRKSTLSRNLEWAATDLVYVVYDQVTVGSNATLTMQPGVAVKFARGAGLTVEGRLQAVSGSGEGVPGLGKERAIVFTSLHDDEVRGDTDLSATGPQPGDWLGVIFKESSSGSVLQGVTIRYAGNTEHGSGAIHLESASPKLVSNEIAHSAGYAISADVNSFPIIQGNVLLDVERGSGIGLRGSELSDRGTYSWDAEDIDLVRVVTDKLTIGPEATLTIAPGTVIKFAPEGSLDVKGRLQVEGTESDEGRIVLTSLYDDDYAGDTDGSADPQVDRSWGGISFRGSDESSVLRHAVVRYAGVWLEAASPRILNNEFLDSKGYAVSADVNSAPQVQGNVVKGNQVNGLEIRAGERTARGEWQWDNSQIDLVRVINGRLIVGPEVVMVIQPGTIVKFAAGGQLEVRGALRVGGDSKQEVVLTSWRDDDYGGDTDGGAAQAQPGDWGGVLFDANSNDTSSSLRQFAIYYATTGLSLTDASPPVSEARIMHCSSQGLVCDRSSDPPLAHVTLEDNGEAGTNCPGWGGLP